jgi:uncharacterized protein
VGSQTEPSMTDAEAAAPAHTNRLANETSPYLLQHAHNPVDWYPWGPEALERAKAEDRPIFLSIGYSACHWCHVMERESFENPEIAAQLNRDFVPIKVDREERPDLDDVYMAAVQAMTGGGGWPMSVFLTPDLQPFFGGTYFPPDDRHGMPGFPRVLAAVTEAYRERRDEVRSQADRLATHLRSQLEVPPGTGDVQERQLQASVARLAATFDRVHGGFGAAPKFPAPMTIEFLLRAWRRFGDPIALEMATVTLDRMAAGGIYDQLAGGFARYSTDARWLVPHFEKMLYDNAQLAHAYLEGYRAAGEPAYARVARETLDFMIRELQTDAGGFASALDADTEGEEGRYYTWQRGELVDVLHRAGLTDAEAEAVARFYGVTDAGNWEGHNVLSLAQADAANEELTARTRGALLAARERRTRPGRDEKQLASWNGMALRALATGALVLADDRYEAAGRRIVGFARAALLRDEDRLWRTSRDGSSHTPAFAEDYANLADGLLSAYTAGGDAEDLRLAERLMRRAIADFWDEASGTLFDTGPEHEVAVTRPRSLIDNATPAANSVAADVLQRLALLVGDEELDRRARSILRAIAPLLDQQPSAFGRALCAADRALGQPLDAVIVGDPADPASVALRRATARPYAPDLVIAPLAPGSILARLPLFAGKEPRRGRPTAFVCRGYACDEPTGDPERAAEQVRGLIAAR